MTAQNAVMRSALWYVRRMGWGVLPVAPGKKIPATEHGVKDATHCLPVVEEMFINPNTNIGIATGNESRIIVLDVDDGGQETLAELQCDYGQLPPTVYANTPSGGMHIFFRHPALDGGDKTVQNRVRMAEGLDIRADGGYVVVAPSKTERGKYAWGKGFEPSKHKIASVPDWLLGMIGSAKENRTKWRDMISKPIGKGQRNETITSMAGHLIGKHVDNDLMWQAIYSINQCACDPPLDEDEIRTIVQSIGTREALKAGLKNAKA